MKNGRPALVLLVACFLLLAVLGTASAQEGDGLFDLAVTSIETQPFSAGIGDETHYFVTLENLHSTPIPAEEKLDLILTVTNAQTDDVLAQCSQPVNVGLLDGVDAPMRMSIQNCDLILTQPGTHIVTAQLVGEGEDPQSDALTQIPGDLDNGNNIASTTIVPVIETGDEGLPTELTRVFAGLAIFFAVMALVAVGTEVTIDSLKVAIGMKRKVTSTEALDRMEKYVPGQLGALSVTATTREQYRRMIRDLRSALSGTLEGVQGIVALREQLMNSEFGDAFRRADLIGRTRRDLTERELYNYKKNLQVYVTNILNTLETRLSLPADAIRPLRDQVAQEISLFDGANPAEFQQEIFIDLQDPHFWSTQIVDGWLSSKQDSVLTQNNANLIDEFNSEVQPLLLGVGFTPDSIEALKLEIVARMGVVIAGVSQATDTFLDSVRNILDAVELRRFDTQSPSRKVWRKLRGWRGGTFPPTRLRATIMPAIYLALFLLYLTWLKHVTDTPLFGGLLERSLTEESGFPISWFLLFFMISLAGVLILYFARRSIGANGSLWFIGLYGASALSLLTGLLFTFLLWVLQPLSANRLSGELKFFEWIQPWWSWLVLFSLILLILLMAVSLVAKYVYNRLVSTAIRDGRLGQSDSAVNALENATIIHRVETLWNLVRQGFDVTHVDPERFDKPDTVLDYEEGVYKTEGQAFLFSKETAAKFIMQRTDQQRDEETSRLRILRVMSIAVGLVIAYALQIDVLSLLGEAFPDVLNQLNWTIVSGETMHAWRSWLPADKAITVGIILTAFAASAGSAFWHDRLDQLQASKKGAQAAAQFLGQAAQLMDSTKSDG